MNDYLIYTGGKSGAKQFITGIPSRNLSETEAQAYGEEYLLSTGLYEKATTKRNKTLDTKPLKQGGE